MNGPAAVAEVLTLHPGDVRCASAGVRMETLLGSCVAVVLTDPRRTVGAMCHIVHSGPASRSGSAPAAAHAATALRTLYALLQERAINPAYCEAYVYGGGNMFPELFRHRHVGLDNIEWVLNALTEDGVAVRHQDVGGNRYRRLSWTVGPEDPHVVAVNI
jgi:chemotaxis protein CheD